MAANPECIKTQDGLLISVTDEYIEGQKGHLEIPGHVTRIGGYSLACHDNLQSVIIPDSVDYILNNAFKDCTNLRSVTIHVSIKGISGIDGPGGIRTEAFEAFEGIKAIKGVEAYRGIGGSIFSGCTSLSSITINTSDPSKENAKKLKAILKKNYPEINISIQVTCQIKSAKKTKQNSSQSPAPSNTVTPSAPPEDRFKHIAYCSGEGPNGVAGHLSSNDNEESPFSYDQQEKTQTNSLLDFAIQHPALIAGAVGALVCVAVIVTIISMGIGGVGIIAGAGAIAIGVGANVGLSAAASAIIATASAGVTAGLLSSGLTFFGLKMAGKSDGERPVAHLGDKLIYESDDDSSDEENCSGCFSL